jgi:hypothetical protein
MSDFDVDGLHFDEIIPTDNRCAMCKWEIPDGAAVLITKDGLVWHPLCRDRYLAARKAKERGSDE